MIKKIARILFYLFIVANIIALWYFSYTNNPSFSIENIQEFLAGQNLLIALIAYTFILTLRGLTLIPGTPFIVLGAIIFPTLYALIAIQIAVQLYICIIYKYSELLDYKIPEKILRYKQRIKKYGIPYIIVLCIIPGMSMNIMAYFLSTLKVPLKTQMIGIGIGAIINMGIYLNVFKILFEVST